MNINRQQIEDLQEAVQNQVGTVLKVFQQSILARKISERLALKGLDAEEYISLCRTDAEECMNLANSLLINVSWFFRNPIVFEIIAQSVLPRLLEKNREIRIWSAGCAAGEEAYSLAILVLEELRKPHNQRLQALIFATDINKDVLNKSKNARYSKEDLRDVKLHFIDRYFSPEEEYFQLSSHVKNLVHFSVDDLLVQSNFAPSVSIFGTFDLILCRNVLIYFTQDYQQQAFQKLYNALAKGGYLVLGESEEVHPYFKSQLRAIDARNRIYQK